MVSSLLMKDIRDSESFKYVPIGEFVKIYLWAFL